MSPGVTLFISELMAKRLELFNGAMPSTPAIATLANPKNPHAVQTIRGHKDRTGVSSGSESAFMVALWLHQPESQ